MDRPIIFSGPMVLALLAGRKTQTRRLFKHQPALIDGGPECRVNGHQGNVDYLMRDIAPRHWAPYKAGDRLYVRERWASLGKRGAFTSIGDATYSMTEDGAHQHRTGEYFPGLANYAPGAFDRTTWRPSIHMPRWASRITLAVTEVRVQRLREVGEADAIAEGIEPAYQNSFGDGFRAIDGAWHSHASPAYGVLMDHLHGKGFWDSNPWVVAITFTVALGNIDAGKAAA